MLAAVSSSLLLLCVFGGLSLVFLLAGLTGTTLCIIRRRNFTRQTFEADKVAALRWPKIAIFIGLPLFLLSVAVVFSILELGPTHGWRSRIRSNSFAAVDDQTGQPVAIRVYDVIDVDDPFLVSEITWRKPDEVVIRWNVPFRIGVSANGYDEQVLQLTESLPPRTVVRLVPTLKTGPTSPY